MACAGSHRKASSTARSTARSTAPGRPTQTLYDNAGPLPPPKIPMSMKKTDLVRQLESKLEDQRKRSPTPGRFGPAGAAPPDKKEQRRVDAAAGLVAFACKLPAPLAQRLRERADAHDGGLNALMVALLERSLAD